MADLKLGRCPHCKAYGLVGDAQGLRYALDVAPVDALGFGKAVGLGVGLLWVKAGQNGAHKLLGAYGGPRSHKQPSWAFGGAQEASGPVLHAEHSCGASARDMVILNVQRPHSAPVTPGSPRGGLLPPDAPAGSPGGRERPSRARPATLRPSENVLRCSTCNRIIDRKAEAYSSIEYETFRWGNHEECP